MTAIGNIGRETLRQGIDEISIDHEAGIAVGTEILPATVVAIGVGVPRSIVGFRQRANQGGLLPLVGVVTSLTSPRRSMQNLGQSFNRLKRKFIKVL